MDTIFNRNRGVGIVPVNTAQLSGWVEGMYRFMFSVGNQCTTQGQNQEFCQHLKSNLTELLLTVTGDQERSHLITSTLFSRLDEIHQTLHEDLESVLAFDPAAKSKSEIILAYPGFYAISIYRISHFLWHSHVPLLPRMISEMVHSKTGIDIHPGAQIGKGFFIDHGTGIVIGETTVIGDNVKIYQGVTLGALNVLKEEAEVKRHPTIEDNVVIYANATILGGKTVVGENSVIGGNVWVSSSVPPNSLVYNKSEIIIKNNKVFPEPLNYVI